MVALLHNIRSIYNTASMFRTADGAGVEKLYLCGITPAPVDVFGKPRQKFVKVSLGAEKTVAWEKAARAADCIARLKREGYFVCALEIASGALPYYEKNIVKKNAGRIAIVVGHETKGLPKPVLKKCDAVLAIPMRGKKESLNVAVAFGIFVFEVAKYKKSRGMHTARGNIR